MTNLVFTKRKKNPEQLPFFKILFACFCVTCKTCTTSTAAWFCSKIWQLIRSRTHFELHDTLEKWPNRPYWMSIALSVCKVVFKFAVNKYSFEQNCQIWNQDTHTQISVKHVANDRKQIQLWHPFLLAAA